MKNDTKKNIKDYKDMTEDEMQEVYDFYCAHTNVTYEENSNNRSSLIRKKQFFNASCQFMSKYPTNDFNLRFFFFMATGPKHQYFKGTTQIIDKESYYLSHEIA